MPSPAICTACSARSRERARSAGISRAPPATDAERRALLIAALGLVRDRRRASRRAWPPDGKSGKPRSKNARRRQVCTNCFWLAAGAHRRRGDLRPACRPVRGQWRLGDRAGALRRLSHPRRAGRRAHAALPWHLHRHHRPDHYPLLSHPSRKGPGHSGRHQDLGIARHRRGGVQRGDRGVCAGGGVDAGVSS